MNRQTISPSRDDRRSIDSKRGVFTSKNLPEQKPSVIPYLNTSLQGIRESLDDIKNINSSFQIDKNTTIHNQRSTSPINNNYQVYHNHNHTSTQLHPNIGPIHNINFQQVHNRSTTPPKVKFNYTSTSQNSLLNNQTVIQNASQTQQHINYVPIIEGPQIRRTFVPLQIKNQVPAKIVINSLNQTPPYRNFQPSQSIAQKDEAYQILIRQYEKLYGALMKQSQRNKNLQILLQKNNSQTNIIINQQMTKILQQQQNQYKNPRQDDNIKRKRRNLSLDVQQLHNLLAKIYQKSVKDIINSRKQSAKSRIGQLFESARKQISSISVENVERTFTYQRN